VARLGYCVHEPRVVFTVDLRAEVVLGVEVYREALGASTPELGSRAD
jgi:hypothetical protein